VREEWRRLEEKSGSQLCKKGKDGKRGPTSVWRANAAVSEKLPKVAEREEGERREKGKRRISFFE